jgi:hypothetical protein
MPSISTLIGERFEDILQENYAEMERVSDPSNILPDFTHKLFYAEAKAMFDKHDYATHLKGYQVNAFSGLHDIKPVVYLIGVHDFAGASKRLFNLSDRDSRKELENMNVSRLYVVDNATIECVWDRRDHVCKKGHIRDCTLRESHLRQIILDEKTTIKGRSRSARKYYGVESESYTFSMPVLNKRTGIAVGHIVPRSREYNNILKYFRR